MPSEATATNSTMASAFTAAKKKADPRNLELTGQELNGQELNGDTWAICKMNMLLHGICSADIKHGDTRKEPLHLDTNGELRRFDQVIANPPFS